MQTKYTLMNLVRALRLPFVSASIFPFIFGSVINKSVFNFVNFCLGFFAVLGTHLSANLLNDYADSLSGADWQDKKFYAFFGGSKLIQEGVFSEKFYLSAALLSAGVSILAVIVLSLRLASLLPAAAFLIIIFLGWSYSVKPLKLSYRMMGEIIIFLLFGPAIVMGAYFIQTGIFPDLKSFMLSLVFGFFTTAILFANEIPDFSEDKKIGKHTWVRLSGCSQAYLIYSFLVLAGFSCIIFCVRLKYLGLFSLIALVFIIPALKAVRVMRRYPLDKEGLVESSGLAIMIQMLISLALIAERLIWVR